MIQQHELETLVYCHGLKKCHHYCFAKEVYVITDDNPLVAMVNKGMGILSQQLQCIMLHIHQYSMYMLYKPGPELDITDWLFHHNHRGNRDQEISGVNITIHTINMVVDIPILTSTEDMKAAMIKGKELQMLKWYI